MGPRQIHKVTARILHIGETQVMSEKHKRVPIRVETFGNSSSNGQKITFYANNMMSEIVTKHYKKGDEIFIEFSMSGSVKFNEDGKEEYFTYLNVEKFKLCGASQAEIAEQQVTSYLISLMNQDMPKRHVKLLATDTMYYVMDSTTNETKLQMPISLAKRLYQIDNHTKKR